MGAKAMKREIDTPRSHANGNNIFSGVSLRLLTVVCGICLTASIAYAQEDSPEYFRKNCMNCHTIGGGRLTGPDLKNVSQQKPSVVG